MDTVKRLDTDEANKLKSRRELDDLESEFTRSFGHYKSVFVKIIRRMQDQEKRLQKLESRTTE